MEEEMFPDGLHPIQNKFTSLLLNEGWKIYRVLSQGREVHSFQTATFKKHIENPYDQRSAPKVFL
jgi:hypothetical protein